MRSWRTRAGTEIFQVLSGRSNSFLISAGEHNLLVDTGKQSAYGRLGRNIDRLGPARRRIDLLVLTHTHFDHCQNAARIKERQRCRIVVGEREGRFAEGGFTPLPKGTTLTTSLLSRLGNRMGRSMFGYRPFTPDVLIDGEHDLGDLGVDLRIIGTRGHSQGSISVLVDDEVAVVGDALYGIFRNSVAPPYADDPAEMVKSWDRLLASGCDTFLPGHGREIGRGSLQREHDRRARGHGQGLSTDG